jgi:acyl-CoA synthetase (AMP-forming)/AMP-acid ligase II
VDAHPGYSSLLALILSRASGSGSHVYLEDARSERTITYAEFGRAVSSWRELFESRDLSPGAPIIVAVKDPLGFAVVHLAAVASGRRSVPINPELPDGEPARSSALIGEAALVVLSEEDRDRGRGLPVATVDPRSFEPASVPEPAAPRPHEHGAEGGVDREFGEGAAVLFTSGSTGTPKGVELRESQLLLVASAIARNNALTSADRGFNSLPLFHINAEVVALLATLVAGATLVLDASFHRTGFWELLAERRITWLDAVPAILAVLTRGGEPLPKTGLRFIRSASAPLPDAVRTALGDIPLVTSWGMTEGASQITATPIGDTTHVGSVGLPLGSEVRVRDLDGRTLPAGEVGALWIRGDGVVRRYLFDSHGERFDGEGWLSTGDLGRIDEDGFVYLVGRSDDVINRGGEKVYPAELEEILLGDPRVLEAVVVARADEVLGFVPVAYVIRALDSGTDHDELVRDLVARCAVELPRFKRPVEISVVPDLPRAPTGKVQRSKVRELAASGAL